MSTSLDGLRRQLRELQSAHERGDIDAKALAKARAPLERQLVEQVMQAEEAPATAATAAGSAPRASRRLQAGLWGAVLALAVVGYALTGTPEYARLSQTSAAPPGHAAAGGQSEVTDAQVQEMVQRLADRLKEQPDDAVGWTMLARAYSAMGRFDVAVPAFQKAVELTGENPDLLADYADSLGAKNNGKLEGEPMKLVTRALAVDPDNVKALALAGSYAFDIKDYATAVRHWERVERALPADSAFLAQVRASLAQARELGGLPPPDPARVAAAPQTAPPPQASASGVTAPAAAAGLAVSGTVNLAPGLLAQLGPSDTVFILARPANGPRMPLAVLRKQVRDLPLRFSLDDSMAMTPTAKISDHAQVIVVARVSKSGDAIAQPGDPVGQSAPVAPGVSGIVVEIREPPR
jgi:cytochrome c-type biogenesis protein CcmH